MKRSLNLLLIFVLALTGAAFAQLHVGTGVGTACMEGCPGVVGGEVTAVGGSFDIFQEAGGANTFDAELLLIAAVPNTAGGSVVAGSVSAAAEYQPPLYATGTPETVSTGQTPTQFGNVNPTLFLEATMTSGQNVFGILGPSISAENNSESFVNFNSAYAAEVAASVPGFAGIPSSYAIYVWSIGTTAFAGKSAMQITSTLPIGTFLTAYGQGGGKGYSTQFTNTGLITSGTTGGTAGGSTGSTAGQTTGGNIPEPGSIVLLGSVLFATFAVSRKKFTRS